MVPAERDARERGRDRDHRESRRERRSRSRERDRDRDRDRRSGRRDYRKGGGRRRHRSPPGGYRRDRERTPADVRDRRQRERAEREREASARTILATNLSTECGDRDLFDFFSDSGTVVDVRIARDRVTRKCKGSAHIEFEDRATVPKALELGGKVLLGSAVAVAAVASGEAAPAYDFKFGAAPQRARSSLKLRVENIHPEVTEADVRSIFEPFGEIEVVLLEPAASDPRSDSLQRCLIRFTEGENGARATEMNSVSVADLSLVVAEERGHGGGEAGEGRHGSVAAASAPAAPVAPGPGLLGPPCPHPTVCVLLTNMFDPLEEERRSLPEAGAGRHLAKDWAFEIAEDVKEECESKFGRVAHVHMERTSEGLAYLKFISEDAAASAQKSLDCRWFAGRKITCVFQDVRAYDDHFKLSSSS